jgi:hypothetical protein
MDGLARGRVMVYTGQVGGVGEGVRFLCLPTTPVSTGVETLEVELLRFRPVADIVAEDSRVEALALEAAVAWDGEGAEKPGLWKPCVPKIDLNIPVH